MKSSIINRISGYTLWLFFSNILVYTSFYYNWKQQLNQIDKIIITTTTAIAFLSLIWLYMRKNTEDTTTLELMKSRPLTFLLTIVFGLIVNFFYFGKSFLYEGTGYWFSFDRLHYFLLFLIPVYIYIILSFSILDMFKISIEAKAANKSDNMLSCKAHYIILFITQTVILGFYFYGLNPGNMSYDTYNQVSQLKGIIPYNTWHPIGHTLFMGVLLNIWDNYAIITIFQIILFSAVTSAFYIKLIENKVNLKIIYIAAIVMSAIPSTGLNVVTQWKDIPFTIGLLWGTFILFKMIMDKYYFYKPIHIIEFILCMLTISLFRFNGILAFIAMFVFAFIYSIKSNNKIQKRNFYISAVSIIAVFILVNNIIPNKLKAVPNPSGMKLRPIYQGLAAMYVYDAEDELNIKGKRLIESICDKEEMKNYYNPYFADTISSNTSEFLVNLSKINTGEALKLYIEALIARPKVIIGDKFNLAVTMWSVTKDPFSYNNAYTTVIEQEMIDRFGVYRIENNMTDVIESIALDTYNENYLSNTLIWRPGFFLSLEFILLLYLIIRKDKRKYIFIPIICNAVIVFLTMPAQDYRYLWFISLIFPFLVLACSVKIHSAFNN